MYSSGILHFMVLSTKEELDERRLNPVLDKKGMWQHIHSNSKTSQQEFVLRFPIPGVYKVQVTMGEVNWAIKIYFLRGKIAIVEVSTSNPDKRNNCLS